MNNQDFLSVIKAGATGTELQAAFTAWKGDPTNFNNIGALAGKTLSFASDVLEPFHGAYASWAGPYGAAITLFTNVFPAATNELQTQGQVSPITAKSIADGAVDMLTAFAVRNLYLASLVATYKLVSAICTLTQSPVLDVASAATINSVLNANPNLLDEYVAFADNPTATQNWFTFDRQSTYQAILENVDLAGTIDAAAAGDVWAQCFLMYQRVPTPLELLESELVDRPLLFWQQAAMLYKAELTEDLFGESTWTPESAAVLHGVYKSMDGAGVDAHAVGVSWTDTAWLALPNVLFGVTDDDEASIFYGNTFWGTQGGDAFRGGSVHDVIHGFEGNDNLQGLAGNDELHGGNGDDVLDGGVGADTLIGGDGNDWLGYSLAATQDPLVSEVNSEGNFYEGGRDDDHIFGSASADTIRFNAGDGVDTVELNGGADVLQVNAAGASPTVEREGKDLVLSLGEDSVTLREWYSDGMDASDRLDRLELLASKSDGTPLLGPDDAPIVLGTIAGTTLTALGLRKFSNGVDDLHGDLDHYQEHLIGTGGADRLFASASYDSIQGGDTLDGQAGNDQLFGSSGSDHVLLRTGDGHDEFTAGGGADIIELLDTAMSATTTRLDRDDQDLVLTYGNGDQLRVNDWASLQDSALVVVKDQTGVMYSGTQLDAMVKGYVGTSAGDQLTGNALDNELVGLTGADTLNGGEGNDTLHGGADQDIDRLYGGAGLDTYFASNGDIINDSDSQGALHLDGVLLTDGVYVESTASGAQGFASADGTLYEYDVLTKTLAATRGGSTVTIENFVPVMGATSAGTVLQATGFGLSLTRPTGSRNLVILTEAAETRTFTAASEVYALAGNDTITGSSASDLLFGNDGADSLNGGFGDDLLAGSGGNDVLDGGRGADTLLGGAGDDTLGGTLGGTTGDSGLSGTTFIVGSLGNTYEGGIGNDIVRGTVMADTYVFNLGDGADTLTEADSTGAPAGQEDVLQFGPGISVADIRFVRSGQDLVAKHVNGTDRVTIKGWYTTAASTAKQIERFVFADGERDAAFATAEGLVVDGTPSADTLAGVNNYANQLHGDGGNDTLTGGNLGDLISGGDGNDVLDGGSGADTLLGGAGADTLGGTLGGTSGDSGLSGTTFIGGALGNTYEGGTGNDTLRGTVMADTYVFNLGDGADTLTEADSTAAPAGQQDVLQFGAGISMADISFIRSGQDLVAKHANGVDQVTIKGWYTTAGATVKQVERFVFADGERNANSATAEGLIHHGTSGVDTLVGVNNYLNEIYGHAGNDKLTGGNLDDLLEGGDGNDTLDGGGGADILRGGAGNDTLGGAAWPQGGSADSGQTGLPNPAYIAGSIGNVYEGGTGDDRLQGTVMADLYLFSLGDGRDFVQEPSSSETSAPPTAQVDVLRFGAGINPGDIVVSRTNSSLPALVLSHVNGQDAVTIGRWFTTYADPSSQLERVEFQDGTVWDTAFLTAMGLPLYGTAAAESLYGATSYSNYVDGGAGNDTILGQGLTDTLIGGDGNDNLDGDRGRDYLYGGAGNDTLGGAPNVQNGADSGIWYNNYSNPGAGNFYFGGSGDDKLQGTVLADVYNFYIGDGKDTIVEIEHASAPQAQVDILRFGAGVAAGDIAVTRAANNLVLAHVNGTDSVTIQGWFAIAGSSKNQVERIEFDNGTVWVPADIAAFLAPAQGASTAASGEDAVLDATEGSQLFDDAGTRADNQQAYGYFNENDAVGAPETSAYDAGVQSSFDSSEAEVWRSSTWRGFFRAASADTVHPPNSFAEAMKLGPCVYAAASTPSLPQVWPT